MGGGTTRGGGLPELVDGCRPGLFLWMDGLIIERMMMSFLMFSHVVRMWMGEGRTALRVHKVRRCEADGTCGSRDYGLRAPVRRTLFGVQNRAGMCQRACVERQLLEWLPSCPPKEWIGQDLSSFFFLFFFSGGFQGTLRTRKGDWLLGSVLIGMSVVFSLLPLFSFFFLFRVAFY